MPPTVEARQTLNRDGTVTLSCGRPAPTDGITRIQRCAPLGTLYPKRGNWTVKQQGRSYPKRPDGDHDIVPTTKATIYPPRVPLVIRCHTCQFRNVVLTPRFDRNGELVP